MWHRSCWWEAGAEALHVEESLHRLHRPHSFMGLRTDTSREVSPRLVTSPSWCGGWT